MKAIFQTYVKVIALFFDNEQSILVGTVHANRPPPRPNTNPLHGKIKQFNIVADELEEGSL